MLDLLFLPLRSQLCLCQCVKPKLEMLKRTKNSAISISFLVSADPPP